MPHLTVRNFHQISLFDDDLKDFIIFIGPQASGKSTLSKIIYFFKKIPDDLWGKLINYPFHESNNVATELKTFLIQRFSNIFDNQHLDEKFLIEYTYNSGLKISIKFENEANANYLFINIGQKMYDELNSLISKINENQRQNSRNRGERRIGHDSDFSISAIYDFIRDTFSEVINTDLIPAGRSILSCFPDTTAITSLENIYNKKILSLNFIMNQFFLFASSLRESLKNGVPELQPYTSNPYEIPIYEIISEKMSRILHGRVEMKDTGEILYYDKTKWIPLSYASSGQQEALWILLAIFTYIEFPNVSFVVIEEPEAHLFPETQKEITELLVMMSNHNNNQVVVTTHSPYILTSLNNLLYAYQVGQKKPNETKAIIEEYYWLDPKKVSVFYLDPDAEIFATSIIDPDLCLIRAELIDSISSKINSTYDKLEQLDFSV